MTFITGRGEGQGKTKKERKATKSKGRGLEEGASRALMRQHGEGGCGERGSGHREDEHAWCGQRGEKDRGPSLMTYSSNSKKDSL